MLKTITFIILFFSGASAMAQSWKLIRNEDGIAIYQAENKKGFKKVKVVTTMDGNLDKMAFILNNYSKYPEWVYGNKTAYLLKKKSSAESYYYSETSLPWPVDNRDAVTRVTVDHDKKNSTLKVTEVSAPDYIPEKKGKVRVKSSYITWAVTAPTPTTINIVYQFEADPGGQVPDWVVNTFADKGPYESFKKLRVLLKKRA